jgi:hypothetical protein
MGVENPDIKVEQAALLDEDIIIAEEVPTTEKVIEEGTQPNISPETGNPLIDELKSRLLSGIPENMK